MSKNGGKTSVGYWDNNPLKAVKTTCALIISYPFENITPTSEFTNGVKHDIRNLKSTLGRYARVQEASLRSEELLKLLGSKTKLRKKFELEDHDKPDLFLVFIITHGDKNGFFQTDFPQDSFKLKKNSDKPLMYFYMSDVYTALKNNTFLANALKLIFATACRGAILENVVHQNEKRESSILNMQYRNTKSLVKETPLNLNAVRVTTEPNTENFITMFSTVESTLTINGTTTDGTVLNSAFCDCFKNLTIDISLAEFLARVMRRAHAILNDEDADGSSPELKIFKNRELTITRKRVKEPLLKLDSCYDWMSDEKHLIWKRKAHFYVSPHSKDSNLIAHLEKILWDKFEFELKQHDSLERLANSVADEREEIYGCIFICIVAELSEDEKTNEVRVKIDDDWKPMKSILYKTIGPTTANWIGKPKICVFLNTAETSGKRDFGNLYQVYEKTKYTRQGTFHEGLMTLILPQTGAVKLFIECLTEYTRKLEYQANTTFLEFFLAVQRRATAKARIQPMVISTLAKAPTMLFPPQIVAKNFTIVNGLKREQVGSPTTIWERISKHHRGDEKLSGVANKKYSVYVISAYAGWGKSVLAENLRLKASGEEIEVILVDLRDDPEFDKALDTTTGYRACFKKYWRMIGEPYRHFGKNEFIILDNLDSLEDNPSLFSMIQELAKDNVSLLIATRPHVEQVLEKCLEGICPVTVVCINVASKEKQFSYMQHRYGCGVEKAEIERILAEIEKAEARDLIEKVGTMEYVATFKDLINWEARLIYNLCEHVFNATAETVLWKLSGLEEGKKYEALREEHFQQLSKLANAFFFDTPVPQDIKNESELDHYGIVRKLGSRVVVLSITLTAYLCVKDDWKRKSIGYWDGDPSKAVGLTCALIIHYPFTSDRTAMGNSRIRTFADLSDIKKFKLFLGPFARIHETSKPKKDILDLISSERKLRKTFHLSWRKKPELFIVFIETHGGPDGLLWTDCNHDYIFNVNDVYKALAKNGILEHALKLVFISSCRGTIRDNVVHCDEDKKKTEDYMNNIEDMVMSESITTKTKENSNAVRVTAMPNKENFIIIFSAVEGTTSLETCGGTYLCKALCKHLESLEQDVGLEEFLTRMMFYFHQSANKYGYGMTPETKIFKHRQLTISKNSSKPNCEIPVLHYDWTSSINCPLLKRKAHFYISPLSNDLNKMPLLLNKLWTEFEFELKKHDYIEDLASAVSAEDNEEDGCVFIFIVAELSVKKETNEICAKINDRQCPIKHILYQTIGPTTGSWIGKPKVCVFLNTTDRPKKWSGGDLFQEYHRTQFSRSGTIHAGLLTLILPQNDAVQFFIENLHYMTMTEELGNKTFQQFFVELQQKATDTVSIKPMVQSTLHLSLGMAFPPKIIAADFTLASDNLRTKVPLSSPWMMIRKQLKNENCAEQNTVFIISAERGWGKSTLIELLAERMRGEGITATKLNIRDEHYEAYDSDSRVCILKNMEDGFSRRDKIIIADDLDKVKGAFLLQTLRKLTKDRVCMVIATTPPYADILKTSLERICSVNVVEINNASRAKQIAFLQNRLGNDIPRAKIMECLMKIERAGAGDLIEKIGTLEKVSSFPDLTGKDDVNIYDLCEHVLNATIETFQIRALSYGKMVRVELAALSLKFFCNTPVDPNQKNYETLEKYGIIRVLESRVAVLSITLAAYLCIYKKREENMSDTRRVLATLPWVPISNNPELNLENSAVFKYVEGTEKDELLEIFKSFNQWFPFYIPTEHHNMNVRQMAKNSPEGQYWAVAIHFLIRSKGFNQDEWKTFQEHLNGRSGGKSSKDTPCTAPYISDSVLPVLLPGTPPQCQSALEFLKTLWVVVQLPFQPALFHQWLVAFAVEAFKISMELSEVYYLLYRAESPLKCRNLFVFEKYVWDFVSQGFKFLQAYTTPENQSDFPDLNFASYAIKEWFVKNKGIKKIRAYKMLVSAESLQDAQDNKKDDPPEELNNIYNLNFWRDKSPCRNIFYDPEKEYSVPLEVEENDDFVFEIDELLESLQAHCNHKLVFSDRLKGFLAKDKLFIRAVSDLIRIEGISSVLRIKKEEHGIIGTMMSITAYKQINDIANRAKGRLCELTGIHPSKLLRYNYGNISDTESYDDTSLNIVLEDSDRSLALEVFKQIEKLLEESIGELSGDCPNYTEDPYQIAKKFEIRIKTLVLNRIKMNCIENPEPNKNLGINDWQFAQYLLPCFVASLLELFNYTNDDAPVISQKGKEWYVSFVHELISAYERRSDVIALDNQYLDLHVKRWYSSPILLQAFFRSTINNFYRAVSEDISFKQHFEKCLQLTSLLEALTNSSNECLPSAVLSSQTNPHFDLLTFDFFLKFEEALRKSYHKLGPSRRSVDSIKIADMNDLIKVMFHVSFYPVQIIDVAHPELPTSANVLLALVKHCLHREPKDDLTHTHRLKKFKISDLSPKRLLEIAKEEIKNLNESQIQSLAFYLTMRLIPREKLPKLSTKWETDSTLDFAFCDYLKGGRMWCLRHFLKITMPGDEWRVSRKFAGENAPVLYYVAFNECNKNFDKLLIDNTRRDTYWYFPFEHCRNCGALNKDVSQNPCSKCTSNEKYYVDINLFCSDECRKNAMNSYHVQEHDEFDALD
ncbi:Hypothetical predicted protein [Cloeon dipterum]|uniref:Caspase family p20 domain-containing protein n=1 Tax=Cloeon dipterum TaxID=197152 RepID=A0A8S1DI91_9INSE|nr:Hypothetical predicted protein [Cloeon dipterum]